MIVITQSAMDIEALSQQTGLLAAMTDNFRGFCVHRQVAPESRDWLAKLMGTIALWQSTDQTAAHGSVHSGRGSRRRVREFRVGSDVFATLRDGEAVIHTTLGPPPARAQVFRVALSDGSRRGSASANSTAARRCVTPRAPCPAMVTPPAQAKGHQGKSSDRSRASSGSSC